MLTELLISKSRDRAQITQVESMRILLQKRELWGSKHYQLLADDMGWSATNLKRLFGLPGHKPPKSLSHKSEEIICIYLEVEDWDELQQKLLAEFTKRQNGHEELKKSVFSIGKKIHEIEKEYHQLRRFFEN
ncbi:MAG: hypothetical protein AAF616_04770 [Bacteroidota bacterium]